MPSPSRTSSRRNGRAAAPADPRAVEDRGGAKSPGEGIEAAGGHPLLAARIEEAVAMARRTGARDAEFDQKAFGDEMWDL